MSYDLYFIPLETDADPESIHEYLDQDGGPDTPASEVLQQSLVEALQRLNPALERFKFDYEEIAKFEKTTVEEARQKHNHIELNGPDDGNGIQITIFSDHATITVPYWHEGPKAEEVFSEIEQYARVLVERGPYRIFEPQLGRIIDDLGTVRAEILEGYCGVVRRLLEPPAGGESKKPWWHFWRS